MNETVFLDTVGLIANWDRSDQWHAGAAREFEKLMAERVRTVTTSFVLLECGNAAARKGHRGAVDRLRASFEAGGRVIFPDEDDWREAWRAYSRCEHASVGIVDQVSILVMKRLGIERVFSNDRHFAAAGLQPLF